MRILGIETSCDETSAAIVEGLPQLASGKAGGTKIISNVVASSSEMHAKTGGIIPENAAREQVKSIIPVVQEALLKAFPSPQTTNYKLLTANLDAIAVTIGPGLIGSLLVGVETAKTLAYVWKKPIIPVNHLVAHIYANFIREFTNSNLQFTKVPEFPALCLVVSGGHTDLVLMKDHGKVELIGSTRDDAAGEAFDKCARLLGLSYPGGPSISASAEKCLMHKAKNIKLNLFPRPLINEDTLDFSFSGLKTAVAREVKERESKRVKASKEELAAQIQEAIVDSLVDKTVKAVQIYKPKSLLISGGVAANMRLRKKLKNEVNKLTHSKTKLFIPPVPLCTDNAGVIGAMAINNYKPVDWKKLSADPELTITS